MRAGERPQTVLAASRAVARIPGLTALLGAEVAARDRAASAVLAWGRKPSAAKAERLAGRLGLPLWRIEDGFLRSIGMGAAEPPLSIVVDDVGIYYDASAPSRLEALASSPHTADERARASRLIGEWRSARVSKYNHAREFVRSGESVPEPYVLAVDQTWGDASIRYGRAEPESFRRMLQAALDENPDSTVLLKVHPEVMTGRKRGHFDLQAAARIGRVRVLGRDAHPAGIIEHAQAVYAVSSQMGFEGLLWGKRVRTFGMPFYAGWGLTQDDLPAPERRAHVLLEDLVHAALVEYPRYLDPETGQRCEPERLIEWMGLQRRMRQRFPPQVYAQGFSPWKKPIVRSFFQGSTITFVRSSRIVPPGATLVVWGRKEPDTPCRGGVEIVRLEDGFLRSVGLGTDLVRPLSWIADRRGMYYDATSASELERILETSRFDASLLVRARSLRERIVALGMTKYNVGRSSWQRGGDGKRVVLVPGQVETDASIRFGSPAISTNLGLLRAVRQAAPDAYVIYKPHPDVAAGLRRKGAGEDEAGNWCDEIVTDVAMGALLDAVDEVHVLTSLAGFEALLRGKPVVVYGQPFYAGWGLTRDQGSVARRTRHLSLDELTAGTLIVYPMYVSRTTRCFTSPERALEELAAWREQTAAGLPLWRSCLRTVLRLGAR